MPGLALDTGKTHEASSPAAPLLLLILNKQFTKRWHDVARSGDKGSPLPAAWTVEEQEACFVLRNYALIGPVPMSAFGVSRRHADALRCALLCGD